jgi:hypothetical protein
MISEYMKRKSREFKTGYEEYCRILENNPEIKKRIEQIRVYDKPTEGVSPRKGEYNAHIGLEDLHF